MHEQESTQGIGGPQLAAGVFALLFLISGADGQELVQLGFLLLAAGCLVLEQCGPALARKLQGWILRWRLQI